MVTLQNSFRIVATEIISFEIVPKVSILFKPGLLDYDIEQAQKVNTEKQLLFFDTIVRISLKETSEQLVTMQSVAVFEIRDFEKMVTLVEPAQFSISRELSDSMGRIATGATRGLLAGKLKGTYLPNAILPLLPFEY